MSDRKLASVRRISAIDPIDGADKIVCVSVDGWKLVSDKTNGFQVGDLAIYFEIDSFLPCIPQFEWMRDRCYKNTENLGEGFRVRTIKLRGQVSQGLIVPLADFCNLDDNGWYYTTDNVEGFGQQYTTRTDVEEGTDLTAFIGVKLFEKPIPAALAGKVRGSFPSFIPKTDQDRVQNCLGAIKKWIQYEKSEVTEVTDADMITALELGGVANDFGRSYFKNGDMWFERTMLKNPPEIVAARSMFEATLKLDGSSMTVYYRDGQLGVCSRNNDLTRDENNTFWQVALDSGILHVLLDFGINIAIQGELMGPGIQGNRENLPEAMFFVFDMYDIDRSGYLDPKARAGMWDQISGHDHFAERADHFAECADHVPIEGIVEITPETTVDTLLDWVDLLPSYEHPIAEGIVFKSCIAGGPSFKVISNKFLLKEKD